MGFAREIFILIKQIIGFQQDKKEKDSHYTILGNVLVRISNHCTYMYVWENYFLQHPEHKGMKIISLVFEDVKNTFQSNCLITKKNRKKPILVEEYVFPIHGNADYLSKEDVKSLIKKLQRLDLTGEFIEPTNKAKRFIRKSINPASTNLMNNNTEYATEYHHGIDAVSESKIYKNTDMKTSKNVIRINESQLKQMISESVKKVLKEYGNDDNSPIWNDSPQSGYEEFTKWGERAAYLIMTEINNKRNEYAEDLFDKEGIRCMCDGFKRGLEDMIENGIINPWATEYEGKIVYNKNGHPWKVNR